MNEETKKPEQEAKKEPAQQGVTFGQKMQMQAMQTSTDVFNPVIYQQFKIMADDLARAGAIPSGLNSQQALVVMQFGSELGIKPFTALQCIYVVGGKLTMYGSMVISRLTQAGYRLKFEDKISDKDDENECKLTVTGSDGEEYSETYTFKMARLSGYTTSSKGEKFGWKAGTNRILKLRYGVTSLLIKSYLPHLLSGAEIKEVWEDVNQNNVQDGEVVDDGTAATSEQIETIQAMGGQATEGLTKVQAAKTIKELTKRK